jgi:hypothetical protein
MATDDPSLQPLAQRIRITVNESGRCLITLPVELTPLKALGPEGLRRFAAGHGWTVVPRLGLTQIEFFAVHLPRVPATLV